LAGILRHSSGSTPGLFSFWCRPWVRLYLILRGSALHPRRRPASLASETHGFKGPAGPLRVWAEPTNLFHSNDLSYPGAYGATLPAVAN